MITKQEALDYHSQGRKGKIEVTSTKPCRTQLDLSLAYTPGVAQPCLEIHKNPSDVYKYTAKVIHTLWLDINQGKNCCNTLYRKTIFFKLIKR